MSFVFRTLGRVVLLGADGPVRGRAVQRRRLAVLSMLAAAPDGIASRDRIVGRIWSDAEQGTGRRLLSDALYALRKALGEAAILSLGHEEIRLNGKVVWADVAAFNRALEADALDEAIRYYEGDFLAGFHVNGSPGFGHWLDMERRSLRDQYWGALERRAREAESAGDRARAIALWKRRAREDPLDSRVAGSLISLLVEAGNPAAALEHARVHEMALREELGLDLPPEITEALGQERPRGAEGPTISSDTTRRTGSSGVRADPAEPCEGDERAAAGRESAASEGRTVGAPGSRSIRRPIVLIALGILLVLGADWGVRSVTAGFAGTAAEMPLNIAVLPVEVAASDPSAELLMEGLRLEVVHGLWSVDGLQVLTWPSSRLRAGNRPNLQAARELGASYVLEPTLIPDAGGDGLILQLLEAGNGEVVWSGRYARGLGPGSLATMSEDVARGVAEALSLEDGGADRARSPTPPTESLAAHDAYIRGRALQWRGRLNEWLRAEALFERATELDPDFAAAWAALAEIRSFMLFFHVLDRPLSAARAALDRASELAPDAVATHRAHVIMHNNLLDYGASREHLRRIRQLEPGNADVPYLLAMLAMWEGRWEESIRLQTRAAEMDPQGPRAAFGLGLDYLRIGRYEEADIAFDRVLDLDPGMPWAAAWRVFVPLKRGGDLVEARRRLKSAVENAGAWPVLYEITKPKAAEVRPFARILIDELASLVADDSVRAELRLRCRPCDLRIQALAADQAGDTNRARAYHDSLRMHFDSLATRGRGLALVGPQVRSWLALELARTGHRDLALEAAEQATGEIPLSRDAFKATFLAEALASVYVLNGEYAAAVNQLEWLVTVPSELTPHVLLLDPMWDPLRSHAGFQSLLPRQEAPSDRSGS